MTDEMIIKALEQCVEYKSCKSCPVGMFCENDVNVLEKAALELLNRQKETIKRQVEAIKAGHKLVKEVKADIKRLETILGTRCEKCPRTETAEIEQWKEEANKYQTLWCEAVMDVESLTNEREALEEMVAEQKADIAKKDIEIDILIRKKEMLQDELSAATRTKGGRFGKWLFKRRYYEADECNCSLCGQLMTIQTGTRMNFCPNCGADMKCLEGGEADV